MSPGMSTTGCPKAASMRRAYSVSAALRTVSKEPMAPGHVRGAEEQGGGGLEWPEIARTGEAQILVGADAEGARRHEAIGRAGAADRVQLLGVRPVVRVEAGDEVASREAQCGVAAPIGSTVDGFADDADAGVEGVRLVEDGRGARVG